MWKLTNVFTLEPTAQTTLVSNKISSWCAGRAAKLNGEWSVLIGSFQVKVDDNRQWVQRHKPLAYSSQAIPFMCFGSSWLNKFSPFPRISWDNKLMILFPLLIAYMLWFVSVELVELVEPWPTKAQLTAHYLSPSNFVQAALHGVIQCPWVPMVVLCVG